MGGLIIRAALPHLAEFAPKFFTFISLGSPHLGYMYNSNKLFDAGMWLLKKWRNSSASHSWVWQIRDYMRRLAYTDWQLYQVSNGSRISCLSVPSKTSMHHLTRLEYRFVRLPCRSTMHQIRRLRQLPKIRITGATSTLLWRRTYWATWIRSYSTDSMSISTSRTSK